MSYFSDDNEKIKLSIMFILRVMMVPLTHAQIATAVMEAAEISYFDIQLAITELERSGYIASSMQGGSIVYTLTPGGVTALMALTRNMPQSARDVLNHYVVDNRDRLLDMAFFSVQTIKSPVEGYDVVLTSTESDRIILSVTVNVHDYDTAQTMCRNWRDKASDVYRAVLSALTDE